MKIQYASDLHLEFTPNFNLVKSIPFEAVGDVLVLAGDIGYLHERKTYETRFWKWASEHYKQVLIVPGNHELVNSREMDREPLPLQPSVQ